MYIIKNDTDERKQEKAKQKIKHDKTSKIQKNSINWSKEKTKIKEKK